MNILNAYLYNVILNVQRRLRNYILRSSLLILLFILFNANALANPPFTTIVPPIGHVSNTFVDATGREVIFHGMNIMQKVPPYYLTEFYDSNGMGSTLGEDWAKLWASNGFNTARVGISWAGVEPSPGVYDDNYILKIRDMIRMFGKYGVYVVLGFNQDQWSPAIFDGNTFPDWAANTILNGVPQPNLPIPYPQGNFTNPALRAVWDNFWHNVPATNDSIGVQDRYINMYAHVVSLLKNEPNILYYEDICEPNFDIQTWLDIGQPSLLDWLGIFGPINQNVLVEHPQFFQTLHFNFKEKINRKIHSVDPVHMVDNELTFFEEILPYTPVVPKPSDRNAVMSRTTFGSILSATNENSFILQKGIAKSNDTGFMVSAFGATIDPLESLPSIVAFFDSNKTSWNYWTFEQGYFPVRTGTDGQSIIINRSLPPTDSNIDMPRLRTIVEPFPRAIAGTPISYSYDPSSNTFNFTFSKIGPKGKEMPSSLKTEIFVPKLNYPNGYNVTVTGGHTASPPNSSTLIVMRNPQADTVSVTITSK